MFISYGGEGVLLGYWIVCEDTRPDDSCMTEPHDRSTGVPKIDPGVDIATPQVFALVT